MRSESPRAESNAPGPRRAGILGGLLLAVLILAGGACRDERARPAEATRDASQPARADTSSWRGRVQFKDRWLPMPELIGREARQDLHAQCRLRQDADRERGVEDPPLCYDATPRADFRTLRVEYHPELNAVAAKRLLVPGYEATHLVVSPSGGISQVLDLAYAPRRAGQVRPHEVRILSAHEPTHQALVEALRHHFPDAVVEIVRIELPARRPRPDTQP